MRKIKTCDIILNILIPIIIGIFIYKVAAYIQLPLFIRNQLPDGLWAYALLSSLLIIWNRELNIKWITASFIFFIVFEVCQFFGIISGTADLLDVLTYFVFGTAALLTNKYFLITLKYKS